MNEASAETRAATPPSLQEESRKGQRAAQQGCGVEGAQSPPGSPLPREEQQKRREALELDREGGVWTQSPPASPLPPGERQKRRKVSELSHEREAGNVNGSGHEEEAGNIHGSEVGGFEFRPIEVHETDWEAASVRVTLNVRMDARFVPCRHASREGAGNAALRVDYGHVVVLDDFFGEEERSEILAELTAPAWDHSQGPPPDKWERETADTAGADKTWGLRNEVLRRLLANPTRAMKEIQSRLALLYPDYDIMYLPSDTIQGPGAGAEFSEVSSGRSSPMRNPNLVDSEGSRSVSTRLKGSGLPGIAGLEGKGISNLYLGGDGAAQQQGDESLARGEHALQDSQAPIFDCSPLLANAPVAGDTYSWHVDADPSSFPAGAYVAKYGDYVNGEPGCPLLVSLLLYLVSDWDRSWDAETLFLDESTDTGVFVRPKRYRAVLMDQDVFHRLSAPSTHAGLQPRYSFVWKLAFLSRVPGTACSIAKPQWGPPTSIGSATRMDGVMRAMKKKRSIDELQV
eukprot:jgi/Botrbrau1/10527/Bobra.7_1s0008.1